MNITFLNKNLLTAHIVYVDTNIIVLYKPAYMHTLWLEEYTDSLQLFLLNSNLANVSLPDFGILQRLDYITSGLILAARTLDYYIYLRKKSKEMQIKKLYIAVSSLTKTSFIPYNYTDISWFKERTKIGWKIDLEVKFVYTSKERQSVRLLPKYSTSKHASDLYKTSIKLEKYYQSFYYFRVMLSKGYRHQVRSTLSALGFPIIGDTLYGGKPAKNIAFRAIQISFPYIDYREEFICSWINHDLDIIRG